MCVCDFLSVSILKSVSSYLLLVSSLCHNEDILVKMLFYTHELDLVHTLWGQAFQWELITSTITYHNMRDSAYLITSLYIVRHGEEEMKPTNWGRIWMKYIFQLLTSSGGRPRMSEWLGEDCSWNCQQSFLLIGAAVVFLLVLL